MSSTLVTVASGGCRGQAKDYHCWGLKYALGAFGQGTLNVKDPQEPCPCCGSCHCATDRAVTGFTEIPGKRDLYWLCLPWPPSEDMGLLKGSVLSCCERATRQSRRGVKEPWWLQCCFVVCWPRPKSN